MQNEDSRLRLDGEKKKRDRRGINNCKGKTAD